LCHTLNAIGQTAYVATDEVSGHLRTPSISEEEIAGLGDFVAVYPERVEGNPYDAPVVVRWLLHRPGAHGKAREFGDSELVYAWSNLVRPEGAGLLWVPTVETELFNTRRRYEREGTCYYVGKGDGDAFGLGESGSTCLSHENVPTREELAGILKRSGLFVCYDNYTLLFWEAGLCGCPAAVVPSGEFSREAFEAWYGLDGIAWGYSSDEVKRAKETVDNRSTGVFRYYRLRYEAYNYGLPEFIKRTQNA
jgi:hypothetical protein